MNEDNSSGQKKEVSKDNVVFVGSKHVMNYVNSIEIQLEISPTVVLRARGKFISKAVDIVEIVKRTTFQNKKINVKDIKIATEEYEKEGKKVRVSTIEIILEK